MSDIIGGWTSGSLSPARSSSSRGTTIASASERSQAGPTPWCSTSRTASPERQGEGSRQIELSLPSRRPVRLVRINDPASPAGARRPRRGRAGEHRVAVVVPKAGPESVERGRRRRGDRSSRSSRTPRGCATRTRSPSTRRRRARARQRRSRRGPRPRRRRGRARSSLFVRSRLVVAPPRRVSGRPSTAPVSPCGTQTPWSGRRRTRAGSGCRERSASTPARWRACTTRSRPAVEEVERARRIVAAWDELQARGEAVGVVDGSLVDLPVVLRARADHRIRARGAGRDERGRRRLPPKEWRGGTSRTSSVGDVYRSRLGRTISEADNTWFTNLTLNTNQVHFNAPYAERTRFGRILVNSTFTLALVAGLTVRRHERERRGQPRLDGHPPPGAGVRRRHAVGGERDPRAARLRVAANGGDRLAALPRRSTSAARSCSSTCARSWCPGAARPRAASAFPVTDAEWGVR